jgi:serine/threonine-protein kinase PpkA
VKLTKLKASCIILAASVFAAAAAWAEQPLLQSGKKTVYQRVVSHPHAKLYAAADGKTEISAPRTFTSFYVYERTPAMLRVGVSSDKSQGWIKSEDTTEWPQAITMVFTDQMGRQPVLFFKDHDSLQKACLSKSAKDFIAQYAKLFETKARIPNGSPVIAAEPMGTEGQVSEKNFYLLPVLNIDTQFKEAGTQLLEVASINPGISPKTKAEYEAEQAAAAAARDKEQNAANQAAATQMKTGLAFVIDTTISMKPYIDQSVQVVKHIYDELQKSPSRDNFEIAIVAFRNNMDKSPGI